jgi:predicted transcriptional regulator of viral defense system
MHKDDFTQHKVAYYETLCLVVVMQPIVRIIRELRSFPDAAKRIYALQDLRALLPEHSSGACKSVITRLEKRGELTRICRGIYVLPDFNVYGSDLLGRVAARLRAGFFNYLSLETVLSEAGVISQIPLSRITLMSSSRSSVISCGKYGTIEFVHTSKKVTDLTADLTYDPRFQLWRASVSLALRDMKATRRDTGLINWETAHEFI